MIEHHPNLLTQAEVDQILAMPHEGCKLWGLSADSGQRGRTKWWITAPLPKPLASDNIVQAMVNKYTGNFDLEFHADNESDPAAQLRKSDCEIGRVMVVCLAADHRD